MTPGKQVRLFLADGTPGGLTTLEITNWTGRIVSAPRTKLSDLLAREEATTPGVYLLLGADDTAPEGLRCYVGETEEFQGRLGAHDAGAKARDFWDRAVIMGSKDANITKAHARYLEARLYGIAKKAGRCVLDNTQVPSTPALPEADVSDMEYFIDQLQICLPVLGINILRSGRVEQPAPIERSTDASPLFHLRVPKHGIEAQARLVDSEFTVMAGSLAASDLGGAHSKSTKDLYRGIAARRDKLVADGSLIVSGSHLQFTRDLVFPSPSTAGSVVTGRSCNGRTEWKTGAGEQFGAWVDNQ